MILSKVYEDAERRLERNEITLGEFERLVDIEVERVVKCGKCKHWNNIVPTRCTKHYGILRDIDDFCSDGERKDNE